MTKSLKSILFFLTAFSLSITTSSFADDHGSVVGSVDKVRVELLKLIPEADKAEIISTEAKNVFRIKLPGSYKYAYVDGDMILFGDLFNSQLKINVGAQEDAKVKAETIANLPTENMIVYGPKDAKHHITVFSDISCGWCQTLHRDVPELNSAGVQVRYLILPRQGVTNTTSEIYKQHVSVWCNDDQQTSLTSAKARRPVPNATCENPIADNYKLWVDLGLRGTPAVFLDDGREVTIPRANAELL